MPTDRALASTTAQLRTALHVAGATFVFATGGVTLTCYASLVASSSTYGYAPELAVGLALGLAARVATATWYVAQAATDRPRALAVAALVAPASAWLNLGVALAFVLEI